MVAFLLLLAVSLSQRRYTSLFQHVKLCVTIFLSTKSTTLEFDTHTVLSRDKVLISLIILLQVLLSSWSSARKVQLCFLCDLVFHLQNCTIQQKLHERHKICLWLERIKSSHKEFAYLLYNSTENTWNSQNLASWRTKLLLCSLQLKIAIFPGGERKFWKFRRGGGGGKFWEPIFDNPKGRGVIRQIPSVGVVWIFSGTTQFHFASERNISRRQ